LLSGYTKGALEFKLGDKDATSSSGKRVAEFGLNFGINKVIDITVGSKTSETTKSIFKGLQGSASNNNIKSESNSKDD